MSLLPPNTVSSSASSLAVRYRPHRFTDVVGQATVISVLRSAITSGRLPAQILFSGESGLGKTTLARIVAAALLCETPLSNRENAEVCGVCESCVDLSTPGRSHPDVIEFDAASNGGKDEIRAIAERALLSPMRASRKVYIIDEAHGLSGPGGQAFLKLLEEPPAHVTFMLATTDPQKMLKTNRGRCTEFELLPPSIDEMVKNIQRVCLGEGWDMDDVSARAVVEVSDPALGVRATLMSLEKLSPSLEDGVALDPVLIALLLGASSPAILNELTSAIEAYDLPRALTALGRARSASTDSSIRAAIIEWARSGLIASIDSQALWANRLEASLVAPYSPGWLELTVARLASPPSSPDAMAALIEAATPVIKELRDLVSGGHATLAGLETLSRFNHPTPDVELSHSHSSTPYSFNEDASDTTEKAPPTSTLAGEPAVAPLSGEPAPLASSGRPNEVSVEEFIVAVGRHAPKAAALLRASVLRASGNSISISTTPENRTPLKEVADPIAKVAAAMGVTLLLAKS